jgi:hypothetical protein
MTFKAEVTVLLPMQRMEPMAKIDAFCQTGIEKREANGKRTTWISGGKLNMRNLLSIH